MIEFPENAIKTPELLAARGNTLYPVFLKLEKLPLLLIGGGAVAEEKLRSLISNSPNAEITLIAPRIEASIKELTRNNKSVLLIERGAVDDDFEETRLVIVATGDHQLNLEFHEMARSRNIPVNVADTPELCDFYLGSIVQKGELKIAISTNGKSPTLAKRLRELFTEYIPPEIDCVLANMHVIRGKLKGDFATKVRHLNEVTKDFTVNGKVRSNGVYGTGNERGIRRIATIFVMAFALMFVGYFLLDYLGLPGFGEVRELAVAHIDKTFLLIVLTGFLAQMADGVMSLGYGAINSMVLLSMGLPPAAISGSIHTAEIFTTGISGYSHYKFGNINKKLFKALLIPGVIGAITGAVLLVWLGDTNAQWLKPILAAYCVLLGTRILISAFRNGKQRKKVKRVGWLAGAGGFLDSFGGGGWGPLVTSTLVSKGKTPRYVVGSVSLCEFFVTMASAFSFFIFLGVTHFSIVIGLIIGGAIAAPIAARFTGKIPLKPMLICVGLMVILWSARIFMSLL